MPQIDSRVQSTSMVVALLVTAALVPPVVNADEPGRGRTAAFEVAYLEFIIDHHFSALRMTELAAGTDPVRDAAIDLAEGTSPSPGFEPSATKATLPEILSMARGDNRMQREEILRAQRFLREWYGREHEPTLRPSGRVLIAILERTPAGRTFDQAFLQVFSRHHYQALQPSVDCLVSRELMHDELERYCNNIVHMQTNEITDMRKLLCREFEICDYTPAEPLPGTGGRE
jgi:uncharacterized protein (DUF305 family)